MKTKAEKNQIAKANETELKESFKTVSNDELMKDLENLNVEKLMQKTALNRSIWKKEILSTYKSEKTARRILRNTQFNLCKSFLTSILTKQDNIEAKAKDLHDFSEKNLCNIKLYSNVSNENNTEKRNILDKAYLKMFIVLNIK